MLKYYAVILLSVMAGCTAAHAGEAGTADSTTVKLLPGHFILDQGPDYETMAGRQGIVSWDISVYGSGAKDGMPFWGTANRRGLFPSNLQTGGNRLLDGMGDNRSGATA